MQQLINLNEIAQEIKKSYGLEMYWNYDDSLSEEQVLKIIKEEDGLNDVENEIYENNLDYTDEIVNNAINEYLKDNNLTLSDDEREDLRLECGGLFDFNIDGLLKHSSINLRVELLSNEDMVYYESIKTSDTIKHFKRVFKNKYSKVDWDREVNNIVNDYFLITFYFKVSGKDILTIRDQIKNNKLELRKGLTFGFFNSWVGGGSVLDITLKGNVTLNLTDWRLKNQKEEILKNLKSNEKSYYSVSIKGDNLSKYSIRETYGLGGFQEW